MLVQLRENFLVHLRHHSERPPLPLRLALRQQSEVRYFGAREQGAAAFGHAATQAPQPMHAAASMARSALSLGTGIAIPVGSAAGWNGDKASRGG